MKMSQLIDKMRRGIFNKKHDMGIKFKKSKNIYKDINKI